MKFIGYIKCNKDLKRLYEVNGSTLIQSFDALLKLFKLSPDYFN